MAFIPARCENCAFEFQPRLISMTGGSSISISDVVTDCPRCGGTARFIDGTFTEKHGKFQVLSASSVTREMLSRLQLLVEEVEHDPKKLTSAKAKAEEIHKGFGSLFTPTNWSPEVKAAVVAAMTALVVTRCSPSPTINVEPRLILQMPVKPAPVPKMGPYGDKPLPIKIRS